MLAITSCSASTHMATPNAIYANVSYGKPYNIMGITYYPMTSVDKFVQTGIASWYGQEEHGTPTATGEIYNMYAMTAAHKTLPLGSIVLVENLNTGEEVAIRVNDRGPFVKGRIIDLSVAAAKRIGIYANGTGHVRVTLLSENPDYYMVDGHRIDIDKGNFAIQIGSFNSYANALNLSSRFKTSKIKSVHVKDGLFYRVWVTGFNDRRRAESYLKDLLKIYPDAFVIAAD
jgi:rare lipoprotein A